jgi:hypothetical protein
VSRYVVTCTWDEVPHLSEEEKASLLASIPAYQRDARTKGVPQLGSGAIFPFPESEFTVAPFALPAHWRRAYGMDAGGGAKPTAAVFGAYDPDALVLYIYDVHKRALPEPSVHAAAIKARGPWIPGVGDCAALIMSETDAVQIIEVYKGLGLDLELPNKGVEAGIYDMWQWFSAGRIKVFASCAAWFEEFRLYRRDDKGRIVKQNDHLMDATRYLVRSGLARAKAAPGAQKPAGRRQTFGGITAGQEGTAWMQ